MTTEPTTPPESVSVAASRHRRLAAWFVPTIILLLAALIYQLHLDSYKDYHPDEGEWIFAGKLYTDLFFSRHDFSHPLWADQFGTWGSFNPQVGKYLIGLSVDLFAGVAPFDTPPASLLQRLAAAGQSPERAAPQIMLMTRLGFFRYSFDNDFEWNRKNQRLAPARVLEAARRGVVFCGIAAGLFIFLIARLLWGDGAGWAALVLFLANPLVCVSARRAMTDMPCLAFVLMGLYGVLLSLRLGGARGWRAWGAALLAGVGFGLAVSTKLSALAPYFASLILISLQIPFQFRVPNRNSSIRNPSEKTQWVFETAIRNLLLLLLLPPAIFFLSNPFLYSAPFSRFLNFPTKLHFMLYLGRFMSQYQHQAALPTLAAKLAYTGRFLLREASPAAWPATAHLLLLAPLAILFLLAALAFIVSTLRARTRSSPSFLPRAAFLFVSLCTWLATIAWLPLAWDRLLLPLVPFYVLALAWGITKTGAALTSSPRFRHALLPYASHTGRSRP